MTVRRRAALLAAAVLTLAGCTAALAGSLGAGAGPSTGAADSPGSLSVTTDGNGDCTSSSPCSLESALGRAASGSVLQLASGNYPDAKLTGHGGWADFPDPVVIEAAANAVPTFGRLTTALPNTTWRGIRVSVAWFIVKPAAGTRVEASHLDGGGLFVRSTDVTVTGSVFEDGSSIDGIQIGGAKHVLIEDNTVRDYNQDRDNGLHADCVQIFDSSDVTLRGNRLANCYNAGIILSVGRGTGIDTVLIESNYVQGCVEKTPSCRGGSAADLREPTARGLTVRNNTFMNGSVRVDATPGLVFDRNIVGYASTCDLPMTNSIVEAWNAKTCDEGDFSAAQGNRTGTVAVVDRASGDLRPATPDAAEIIPVGSLKPASETIDRKPTDPDVAGASG